MIQEFQEIKNTASVMSPREDLLLKLSGPEMSDMEGTIEPATVLDWEGSPKLLEWPMYTPLEEKEDIYLHLPERLTNSQYGTAKVEENLKELAKNAPDIADIWKITEKLPSLTQLIVEERENE